MLFITTASGQYHRALAENLKASFKKYNWPNLIVVNDLDYPEKNDPTEGRRLKWQFADFIPSDYTGAVAFIDCDCEAIGEYQEVDLEGFDMAGIITQKYKNGDGSYRSYLCTACIIFSSVELAKEISSRWHNVLNKGQRIGSDSSSFFKIIKMQKVKNIGTRKNPMKNLIHYVVTSERNKPEIVQERNKNFAATALILNWKRKENLLKTIQSIRSQDIPIEIFLWNNNKQDTQDYDVDLRIDSSHNLMCFPRWFMAQFASSEYVFSIDDDKMFTHPSVVSDCIKLAKEKNTSLCYQGVIFPEEMQLLESKDYMKLKHVSAKKDSDIQVDILKGSFLFSSKKNIVECLAGLDIDLYSPKVEDDIFISSKIKGLKICPALLADSIKELPQAEESLCFGKMHTSERSEAINKYFIKPS